jgi:uncharacterized protein (TIGR02147 family)
MEQLTSYYILKLQEGLSRRQKENPSYSLRAFARDLNFHPGTLTKILKGQRPFPSNISSDVSKVLKLSPKEHTLFMESVLRRNLSIDKIHIDPLDRRYIVEASNVKIIAEWEHFAVLDIFDVEGFERNVAGIARRFSITPARAEEVVNNLLISGLLETDEAGLLCRIHTDVKTTEDLMSEALKASHAETLNLGLKKLAELDVELRDFSSMAAAVDMEQLLEAKTIIREFRQKMSALLKKGSHKTEVYQLAIQFYPLTNCEKL